MPHPLILTWLVALGADLALLVQGQSCPSRIGSKTGDDWMPDCSDGPDTLIPDPFDCTLYWQCDSGLNPIPNQCPGGLHFNPTKCVCDYPDEAGCENSTSTTSSPTTPSYSCPLEWLLFQDTCFYFAPEFERVTWLDADILCQVREGSLVEVRDEATHHFILQQLYSFVAPDGTFHNDLWWLGASDEDLEGQWMWTRLAEPVGSSGFDMWARGEPHDCGDGSCELNDCMIMHRYLGAHVDYYWSDQRCNAGASFICQRSATTAS